jgi:hypothetical protein
MARFLIALCFTVLAACSTSLQRQIELAPLGDYTEPAESTDTCAQAVKLLEKNAGVPVLRIEGLGPWGSTDFDTIFLRAGMSSCAEMEVLAHEAAHLRQPVRVSRREAEMFADVVSLKVTKILGGYDATARYLPYLAQLKPDARIIGLFKPEIDDAVRELTAR